MNESESENENEKTWTMIKRVESMANMTFHSGRGVNLVNGMQRKHTNDRRRHRAGEPRRLNTPLVSIRMTYVFSLHMSI